MSDADWPARLAACRELILQGEYTRGRAAAEALHAQALAAAQPGVAAQAALMLTKVNANLGRPAAAVAWGERTIDAAVVAGDPSLQASAWVVIGGCSAELDRPADAIDAVARALALTNDGASLSARRSLFTGIAITYNALGLPQMALPASRRAFEAEHDDPQAGPHDRLRTRWNLLITGVMAHDQLAIPQPAQAETLVREMLDHVEPLRALARTCGQPDALAGTAHVAGQVLLRAGRLDEALALMQEAVDTPTDETAAERCERWADLASAQALAGRADDARRSALEAVALQAQIEGPLVSQDMPRAARLHELLGRPDEALRLHREHHARVVHNLLAAVDVRLADLGAKLEEQTLRLENLDLRERAAGLATSAQTLAQLARTDALTGLPNRVALEEAYRAMQDSGQPFALLLVDLDHFKAVNDRYSHAVGDTALREFGAVLSDALRSPDVVGRWGGEEFLVLLSGVTPGGAVAIAERLRAAVAAHAWEPVAPGLRVTLSGGLVACEPDEPLARALARADVLLYRAKHEGRDRVVAAVHAAEVPTG